MPAYKTQVIRDIENGLLKYRGMQPNPRLAASKFFHFNNLLNKDNADNALDPWAATRGLSKNQKGG